MYPAPRSQRERKYTSPNLVASLTLQFESFGFNWRLSVAIGPCVLAQVNTK